MPTPKATHPSPIGPRVVFRSLAQLMLHSKPILCVECDAQKQVRPLRTVKLTRLTFCTLLAVSILLTGCKHSNPIAGWKSVGKVGCKVGEMSAEISPIPGYEAISEDAQKFVNKLPVDHLPDYCGGGTRRWCYWISSMTFFEDDTGQHGVSFEITHDGTRWGYVLIYDKSNKRIKAVRY